MTISRDDLSLRPGPRYQALATALGEAIGAGRLKPGDRLPPQRELALRLGVTVGTVGRAYDLLAIRGQLRGEVGRGTYVAPAETPRPALRIAGDVAANLVDLGVNRPAPTAVLPSLIEAIHGLAGPAATRWLDYVPGVGLIEHRAALADWQDSLGLKAAPEQVLVSAGAHAGLYLALQTLCRPGDAVLVEQLAYPGLADILRVLHLRPEPLPLDGEGLVPEGLADACRHGGPQILVLTPNLQNPTTATLGTPRREAIAELARRHELMLLEDDVYGPLLAERPPTLASLVPERVIHIASISKAVVPGLRLGSLVAPPHLAEALASGLHALRIAEPPLMAELFRRWLEAGLIEQATLAQRAELAARQNLAQGILAGSGASLTTSPEAPHIWLGLPPLWRGSELGDVLMRQGVHVAVGELFTSGRGTTPAAIRISLGGAADQAQLGAALAIVRDALTAGPPARPAVI